MNDEVSNGPYIFMYSNSTNSITDMLSSEHHLTYYIREDYENYIFFFGEIAPIDDSSTNTRKIIREELRAHEEERNQSRRMYEEAVRAYTEELYRESVNSFVLYNGDTNKTEKLDFVDDYDWLGLRAPDVYYPPSTFRERIVDQLKKKMNFKESDWGQ